MSGHTPGPWFVTGNMTLYVEARIGGGLLQEVASVGPTEADSGYGPQQRANADLIAAAPELLEALRQITKQYVLLRQQLNGDSAEGCEEIVCVQSARKAIAKARGEPC